MNYSKLEILKRQRARVGKLYLQAVADKEHQDILDEIVADMHKYDQQIQALS